jgi:hypothetical protein
VADISWETVSLLTGVVHRYLDVRSYLAWREIVFVYVLTIILAVAFLCMRHRLMTPTSLVGAAMAADIATVVATANVMTLMAMVAARVILTTTT